MLTLHRCTGKYPSHVPRGVTNPSSWSMSVKIKVIEKSECETDKPRRHIVGRW